MARTWKIRALAGLFVVALLVAGCGKKEEPAPPPSSAGGGPTGMADPMKQAQEAMQQANQGTPVAAVAPATLKEMLPAALDGMKQTDASSERTQMGGVDLSMAEADYAPDDGDASIHITIMDAGSLSGPMRMGLAGWAMTQYSRETETGYQKTTTYAGHKAMEEYDTQSKGGSLYVYVADRFVVQVEGQQTTMDAIKQAAGKIDIKKLAGLK
ncbi:MAG: hypothetical protein JW993_15390 [Sedimentisphaerales bacterium]|nr:hypothetical protein [Sedimentisphaerales bacterium]